MYLLKNHRGYYLKRHFTIYGRCYGYEWQKHKQYADLLTPEEATRIAAEVYEDSHMRTTLVNRQGLALCG